jgi:hypothetical protein
MKWLVGLGLALTVYMFIPKKSTRFGPSSMLDNVLNLVTGQRANRTNYGGLLDSEASRTIDTLSTHVLGGAGLTIDEQSAFWESPWNPISYFRPKTEDELTNVRRFK